jgi:hypothetical protein
MSDNELFEETEEVVDTIDIDSIEFYVVWNVSEWSWTLKEVIPEFMIPEPEYDVEETDIVCIE